MPPVRAWLSPPDGTVVTHGVHPGWQDMAQVAADELDTGYLFNPLGITAGAVIP